MTHELVAKTFELQNALNEAVNPNWRAANYPWYRAAWIEAAELMDHLGYKWWKNVDAEQSKQQALLELVDIYHFLISDMIVHKVSPAAIVAAFARVKHIKPSDKEAILLEIEGFVSTCSETQMILPVEYARMVTMCGFTIEHILKWYIGKNCLNIFRQNNGYKDGSYVKIWDGLEDNEVLANLIGPYETVDYSELYQQLKTEYQKLTTKEAK